MLTAGEALHEKERGKIKFKTELTRAWWNCLQSGSNLASSYISVLFHSAFFDYPSMTKQVTLTLHLWSYQTMTVLFMIQLVSAVICGRQQDLHACVRIQSQVLHKKGIGRKWCSIYADLHLSFTRNGRSGVNLPSHSRQCQKPFSLFWPIFISGMLCPSSEKLTQGSPVSVALNSTRYRKEDLMCTSAVFRTWAF